MKFIIRKLRMDKFTDRLSLGTFSFFFIVKFLQFLQRLGFTAREDGWRRVTQSYLRTEHSKFALAVFRLNFWSDLKTENDKTLGSAKKHLIERLTQFLGQHPVTHWQLQWNRFSVKRREKKCIDIVHADFDENGNLESIEPYLDSNENGKNADDIDPELRTVLIRGIINSYNKTKDLDDKTRPRILKRELHRWFLKQPQLTANGTKDQAEHFIERVLSAALIHFEKLPLGISAIDERRLRPPCFIKCKHPGFGPLNILCRFTDDLNEVDLWVQFSHIPTDGVPVQEVLEELKREWGKCDDLKFPSPDYNRRIIPELCSAKSSKNEIYHINQFVDFQPLRRLRKELNKRYARQIKEKITIVALFVWKLAQSDVFKNVKFAVPVDLCATTPRERTLGFVFIRPGVYFDKDMPDKGFLKFHQEFDRQLQATRERRSESYRLLESYALTPPLMYSATLKLLPFAVREFVGTMGVTIIKGADLFIAPFNDVHTDGFVAIGNFLIPAADGSKVCNVSIKGPKDKVVDYLRAIEEAVNSEAQI